MDQGPIRQCSKPGCRTLTRSARYKQADHPGTLPRLGGGLCIICHHEANPMECVACGHPVRISTLPAKYAPGTRMRRGGGLCDNCSYEARPKTIQAPARVLSPEELEYTRRGLEAFLSRRRERQARFAS
jgi:hypothetical protein